MQSQAVFQAKTQGKIVLLNPPTQDGAAIAAQMNIVSAAADDGRIHRGPIQSD